MHGFDSSSYKKEEIKCKVLSDVRLNLIPFTNGPMFYSSVRIKILEPEYLKSDDTELILQQRMSWEYTGHEYGELWQDIGSIHDITVFRNIKTSTIYLYPEAKGGWKKSEKNEPTRRQAQGGQAT
jgi:hypothetical protein